MYDLTNTDKDLFIFEIDDGSFAWQARFMRAIDELRALGVISNPVETGLGLWEGAVNTCYVMTKEDADLPPVKRLLSYYAADQDAFLIVHTSGTGELVDTSGGAMGAGPVRRIAIADADKHPGFTMLRSGMYVVDIK